MCVVQQQILLGLVEAMDLVDHQDGLARRLAAGVGQDLSELRRARKHGVDADDVRLGLGGDHLGQGRLAAAGRTVEEERTEVIGLDQARQQSLRAEQAGMPDDLREVPRAHARSERAAALRDGIGHPLA